MFIPRSENIPPVERYPTVVRELPTIDKPGWVEVDGVRLDPDKDFIFQTGFQEALQISEVDLLGTGGEASAGKTFGILLKALQGLGRKGYNALIVKRELVEAKAVGSILPEAKRIYKDMPGCNFTGSDSPTFEWEAWGNSIQLTHMNLQGEQQEKEAQEKMKNKQASFIAIDELTNFTFKVFKYWFSRNRDSSGRGQMVFTLNANGWHWTRQFLSWYINPETNFLIPERIGKIRYFYILGDDVDDIIWGDSKEEVKSKIPNIDNLLTKRMKEEGLTVDHLIKSFTFIPGNIMDNRILTNKTQGGNIANLANLGEAERMKLLYSYWGEMSEGTAQVTHSQIRQMFGEDILVSEDQANYLTVDLGDGGDPSKAYIWKGLSVIAIEHNYTSDARLKVAWVRSLQNQYNVPVVNTAVDASGLGNYFDDYLKGVVAIISNRVPILELDADGNRLELERYVCLRDQLLGKLTAYIQQGLIGIKINPEQKFKYGKADKKGEETLLNIYIKECEVLKKDTKENGKIFFLAKKIFKQKYGHSPDDFDCLAYRMIFELDAKLKKDKQEEYTEADVYACFNSEEFGW